MRDLRRGDVVWVDVNPTRGREQFGERPVVIDASNDYLERGPGPGDRTPGEDEGPWLAPSREAPPKLQA